MNDLAQVACVFVLAYCAYFAGFWHGYVRGQTLKLVIETKELPR